MGRKRKSLRNSCLNVGVICFTSFMCCWCFLFVWQKKPPVIGRWFRLLFCMLRSLCRSIASQSSFFLPLCFFTSCVIFVYFVPLSAEFFWFFWSCCALHVFIPFLSLFSVVCRLLLPVCLVSLFLVVFVLFCLACFVVVVLCSF